MFDHSQSSNYFSSCTGDPRRGVRLCSIVLRTARVTPGVGPNNSESYANSSLPRNHTHIAKLSGTRLRELIKSDQKWHELVPEGTKLLLENLDAKNRLKIL